MKKNTNKILLIITLTIILSSIAYADMGIIDAYKPDNTPLDVSAQNLGKAGSVAISILRIISGALLYFAAPTAVIFIVINALNMARGGADSELLEQSKKGLKWTIIGLLVIILSAAIVRSVIEINIKLAEDTKTATESSSSGSSGSSGGSGGSGGST